MLIRYVKVGCNRCNSTTVFCIEVERKVMFGWKTAISTYDQVGDEMAEHFSTLTAAQDAARKYLENQIPPRVLLEEYL